MVRNDKHAGAFSGAQASRPERWIPAFARMTGMQTAMGEAALA